MTTTKTPIGILVIRGNGGSEGYMIDLVSEDGSTLKHLYKSLMRERCEMLVRRAAAGDQLTINSLLWI